MRSKKTQFIAEAAVIAAIYTVLVVIFQPISFGPIQFRIAELLTVLPYFTPAAIPGVTIGCFISAIVTSAEPLDMIFGSLATLIAAFLSYKLKRNKFLVPIPPIAVNALIVPWVLRYAYGYPFTIPFMMLTVGVSEFLAVGVLGMVFLFALEKVRNHIFKPI